MTSCTRYLHDCGPIALGSPGAAAAMLDCSVAGGSERGGVAVEGTGCSERGTFAVTQGGRGFGGRPMVQDVHLPDLGIGFGGMAQQGVDEVLRLMREAICFLADENYALAEEAYAVRRVGPCHSPSKALGPHATMIT